MGSNEMTDYGGERLLTYIHGPAGEAGMYEAFEPIEPERARDSSAVLLPGEDGNLQRIRLVYVVRFRESVRETYFSLGEAYLAAGQLVGVEAGTGTNPSQYLTD